MEIRVYIGLERIRMDYKGIRADWRCCRLIGWICAEEIADDLVEPGRSISRQPMAG